MSMTKYKVKYLGVILFIVTIVVGLKGGNQDNVPQESKKIKNEADAIAVIKNEHFPPQAIVALYKNEIQLDTNIIPMFAAKPKIAIKNPSWLFIVDEKPSANFPHPIKIRLINSMTGIINDLNPDSYSFKWWPMINKNYTPYFVQTKDSMFTLVYKGSKSCKERGFCDSPFPGTEKLVGLDIASRSNVVKEIWAIIICGDFASDDELAFAKDTDSMYSVLQGYGVPENQIFYFVPDDVKNFINSIKSPDAVYKTNFIFKNINNVSEQGLSKENIEAAFSRIKDNIKENGRFLFLISTHGGDGSLTIRKNKNEREINENEGEIITIERLKGWINKIKCEIMYILIDAFHSGSFAGVVGMRMPWWPRMILNSQNKTNRFVIFSCGNDELSYSDIDNEQILGENNFDRGTEFLGGFIDAFAQKAADCSPEDGKISLGEAFEYAKLHAYCAADTGRCPCEDGLAPYQCTHPGYSTNCMETNAIFEEFLFWEK